MSIEVNPLERRYRQNFRSNIGGHLIGAVLLLCASVTVVTTLGIVAILLFEGLSFFKEVSAFEFFTGTKWTPLFTSKGFGVLPLVSGTLLIGIGAALVALPLGTLTAIFLSEYASPRVRSILKPSVEVLSGIPTVVYGYFALTFISPFIKGYIWPDAGPYMAISAIIVVGIMIVPIIASISDDALRAVPKELREAAYGVGANRLEVTTRVAFPAALSGIVASYILAISRAIGETMAVTIAAGARPNLTANPFEAVQTMTAYIVSVSLGDTPHGTIEFKTIFAVGLTLFFMTLIMNLISARITRKYREVYD
jgi:phosphate transport system permease protein|tara:strand:+ start:3043 stop:3972 length:930 start_codon:yes stop_codon:yes gene_type:complete